MCGRDQRKDKKASWRSEEGHVRNQGRKTKGMKGVDGRISFDDEKES